MKEINFIQAIIDHVVWNVKLRSFLDGKESISHEEAISQNSCMLGKWLSAHKPSECAIPEIQELRSVHIQLHAIVKQVIELKLAGNISVAEGKLAGLKSISEQIIYLLVAVDKKIRETGLDVCTNIDE